MKIIAAVFMLIFITKMNAQIEIIAHRGYWKTEPETAQNSLQSLKNAQKIGVYGSEFDVRMTKDGVPVINHDEHHGTMEISETNFTELRKLKLSNGESIPTLKEYLLQGKKKKSVKMIVEIKPAKTQALENRLVELTLQEIRNQKMENQCIYISFSKNICLQIQKAEPKSMVQYLASDLAPSEIKQLGLGGIDYYYKILTEKQPEWIPEANALSLVSNAWTVDDAEIFEKLKSLHIKFITTNEPEKFLKLAKDQAK